ncbi:MAG: DUF1365 domain-containing protein [Alphaproteobacteria bacterium GM202ARS2]|nr:DUF1365 domain-containing protein [Alphaproteobacteria bacterium GM202ARS2]
MTATLHTLQEPHIFVATVRHKRLAPKVNAFAYPTWCLAFDSTQPNKLDIPYLCSHNKARLVSLHAHDYGKKNPPPDTYQAWQTWLQQSLKKHQITTQDKKVILVAMPRVLGYVFNPISFWLIIDPQTHNLHAVICEVTNTFKERHHYVCLPKKGKNTIQENDILTADKHFHVSPFFSRRGFYRFQFQTARQRSQFLISYYDDNGKLALVTSLQGHLIPHTRANLARMLIRYGPIALRAMTLIHWQALKLAWKKTPYIIKPQQKPRAFSTTQRQ